MAVALYETVTSTVTSTAAIWKRFLNVNCEMKTETFLEVSLTYLVCRLLYVKTVTLTDFRIIFFALFEKFAI